LLPNVRRHHATSSQSCSSTGSGRTSTLDKREHHRHPGDPEGERQDGGAGEVRKRTPASSSTE
jgi:hypothetical protein